MTSPTLHPSLSEALPAWINAVTVVALAAITWWYARSTKRQANAAESQAKAAAKQADAADKSLALLQSQIQERAGAALAALKRNIEELNQTAAHWQTRMASWGALATHGSVELFPVEWAASLEYSRSVSPELYENLVRVQGLTKDVSLMIDQFALKGSTYRQASEANVIANKLASLITECEVISKKLSGLS